MPRRQHQGRDRAPSTAIRRRAVRYAGPSERCRRLHKKAGDLSPHAIGRSRTGASGDRRACRNDRVESVYASFHERKDISAKIGQAKSCERRRSLVAVEDLAPLRT